MVPIHSALPALAAPAQSAAIGDCEVPDGLSATDWTSIRAAYEAGRFAATAVDGGFEARNPGQSWHSEFDERGFEVTPDAGDWSWGLNLVSFGRAEDERAVAAPICVDVAGNHVSYQWTEGLTEWYVNDARGLEHGYTVQVPPGIHKLNTSVTDHEPMRITLAIRGGLVARVNDNGRDVTFVNSNDGSAIVMYRGLKVFDADGADVPSRFEVVAERLRLIVDDRAARYPLTIDPIAQQAYLKASNTNGNDQFGRSVAVSGDTVVVGAPFEDSSATGVNGHQANGGATDSGAAYVFVRNETTWSQQAYLKASNTEAADHFGWSLAVSGDTAVVGAPGEDSGATGVDGDQTDNTARSAGAAYIFVRSGSSWSQQAYLKASNTDGNDQFGSSVAVSDDTVVVGALGESSSASGVDGSQSDNNAPLAGAAYAFIRSGTTWSQQAYLKASNTESIDSFGSAVALSGDTAAVGARFEDSGATGVDGDEADNNAPSAGAAYVFIRSGTVWSQQAYLKASNTDMNDQFGASISVSGDTVLVGARLEDSSETGANGLQFDNSAADAGAAYVFVRSGTIWSQQAYLKASNTDAIDLFGGSVSVSGDTAVVGAHLEDSSATGVDGHQADNSANDAGAAYVFVRSGTTWSQRAYLKALNTDASDSFGASVAVSAATVVVGAAFEDSIATGVNGNESDNSATNSGAVYVYLSNACPIPGDMNCDCVVDLADVPAFVQALLAPATYAATFPDCHLSNGDMQTDGNVDGGDTQGFLNLLSQ